MGSPVSVVVTEIVDAKHRGTSPSELLIPLWLRYVDDTFTTVHRDEIKDFSVHEHLHRQNHR